MVKPVVAMVEDRPQEEGVAAQISISNIILVYQMLDTFLKCLVATSKAIPDFGSLAREIEAEHGLGIFFQCIIHTGTKISNLGGAGLNPMMEL